MRSYFLIIALFAGLITRAQPKQKFTEQLKAEMRVKIVDAARHAWSGYKLFAWGYDDLRPLTKTGRNWYKSPVLMTPVDAFDTFLMLGMHKEAKEAKELILTSLTFNTDNDVQVFEVTIRILAGLLTAYEMDGDKRFLVLAKDLGDRMMPAFNSTTGLPYRYVHLQSGKTHDSINNPAEIGTLLLEFGKLSELTADMKYYDAARKAILYVYNKRSVLDLVGERIDIHTGEWQGTKTHISGYIDSYYEYLYKGWLLFHDKELKVAFDTHNKAIKKHLISPTGKGSFMHHVDMHTGKPIAKRYGALDAFYAGLCALSGDVKTAAHIQRANYYMWTRFNMEPEEFDFGADTIISGYYILRPENIESCFYLFRTTGNDEYLWMAKDMTEDILANCRTEAGFSSIKNVVTLEKHNSMESFFFAETLKYAYLLFADDSVANLQKIVFNTEAHPFKILRKKK